MSSAIARIEAATIPDMQRYVGKPLQPFIDDAFVEKAEGATYRLSDGRRIINFISGFGPTILGDKNREVLKTAQWQMDRGVVQTDFSIAPYKSYVALAKGLSQIAENGEPMAAVFFNSGAEAVENAIKIARHVTGRSAVVCFDRAFHGRTMMALTLTHKEDPYKKGFGPLAEQVYRVPFACQYHYDQPWRVIEEQIRQVVDPKRVACVIVEPIQGEGGFRVPNDDFLAGIRRFTRQHQIIMAVDEVQTGFGRTGKFFGYQNWGVNPDLIAVAKGIANGFVLSGVIGKKELFDQMPDNSIGGTYVGNPVSCAAGVAVLEEIETRHLVDRANKVGEHIRQRLVTIKTRNEIVGDVRGLGIMQAIELVTDSRTKTPATQATKELHRWMFNHGLLTALAGYDKNVIRLLLPLTISYGILNQGLNILEDGIAFANKHLLAA